MPGAHERPGGASLPAAAVQSTCRCRRQRVLHAAQRELLLSCAWRCYLEGRPFTIVTDHKPNTYLDESTNPHTLKRRARWLDISCAFQYEWVYRPGRINVADPISRAPQHRPLALNACVQVARTHDILACRLCRTACQCLVCHLANSVDAAMVTPDAVRTMGCPKRVRFNEQVHVLMPKSFGGHRPQEAVGRPSQPSQHCMAVTRRQAGTPVQPVDRFVPHDWLEPAPAAHIPAAERVEPSTAEVSRDSPSTEAARAEPPLVKASAPSQLAPDDDEGEIGRFFQDNFVGRLIQGCAQDACWDQDRCKRLDLTYDEQGLLWTKDSRLVIPGSGGLRFECFESVHSPPFAGHYGKARTVYKAKQVYWWPRMAQDIEYWCKSCDPCQRVKAVRQKPYGLLQPLQIPGRRWESVSMDLITDLPPSEKGNDSIWVVVDRLSKMAHLKAVQKTCTAHDLALCYEDAVFKHHGIPRSIVSDRDPRFTAAFWRELAALFETELCMSTADHAQTDGQTENANGVLEDTLRHFVGPYQRDWESNLPVVEFAMNNAYNSSIKTTPFMLNYGQNPDDPTLAFLRSKTNNPRINGFIGRWSEQLSVAKQCLRAAQDRMKAQADKRRRDAPDFRVGDEVLLHTKCLNFSERHQVSRKLAPRWVGPFKIVQVIGKYRLACKLDLPSVLKRVHPVFHVSKLRPYLRNGHHKPPPLPVYVDGVPEHEVSHIVAHQLDSQGRVKSYRVAWLGEGENYTDEVPSNLTNCNEALQEYWANLGIVQPQAAPF